MELIRVIKPKTRIGVDPAFLREEIGRGGKVVITSAINHFKKPVREWRDKPSFEGRVEDNGDALVLTVQPVGPNAEKFTWVDQGVEGRVITPVRKPFLQFRRHYLSSTIPGRLWSRHPKRYGNWVRKKAVIWKGIRPRNFSEQVHDLTKPEFQRQMRNALQRAIRRTKAQGTS